MLLAWFRGAFLVGILAWYSINVWKLIDGYFKDQFENYLKEEYRKNPRMKTDVEEANSVNKKESVVTEIPSSRSASSLERIVEQVEERRSLDVVGSDIKSEGEIDDHEIWHNEEKLTEAEEEACYIPGNSEEVQKKIEMMEDEKIPSRSEENVKNKRLSTPTPKHSSKKKQRVKTITLKESDFAAVAEKRRRKRKSKVETDKDFWEFEEDEEEAQKDHEGISLEELPFKPRVDGIGRLDRVTPDEYCPLTLEDELSCGETTKWP